MSVRIEATGASIADALAAFGPATLESVATDDLLSELRHRFAAQEEPMVVRIVPFAEKEKA
jgi:hypothetical protein